MVDPSIGMKRLTKVLVDGDSGLNIMYAKTLDAMGIDRSRIRSTGAPFHGIVPRKQFMAIPNYTYLKLKMPGPRRIIIVGTSFQRAYECEVECCEHATKVL
ncbi:uncharacterized protein [Miscanthus floridulus]|uniref:uncharacterized protein n=1 Tax=Miscanthus floridulus TaxID=154761 RepID=UPI00345ACF8D